MPDDDEHDTDPLLDKALRVRRDLNATEASTIQDISIEFPALWELLVLDLNDGGLSAGSDFARLLSVQPSVLTKFLKPKKPILVRDARTIADRIVTHLRSQESPILEGNHRLFAGVVAEEKRPPPLVVEAVEWKVLVRTDELTQQIAGLIRLIEQVIQHATTTNLPDGERALTDIERAQLIAVLKTAVKMLEAPMVEKGLLKKAGSLAKRAGEKAAEKQVELALGGAATVVGGLLMKLVHLL